MNEAQRAAWQALGLGPLWRLREAPGSVGAPVPGQTPESVPGQAPDAIPRTGEGEESTGSARSRQPATERSAQPATEPAPQPAAADDRAGTRIVGQMDWDQLRATVSACQACALGRTRTQTVFGVGPLRAPWMLIGEAPGAEEDARGEPFVGQAGRLLDNMLSAIGLSRQRDVFIANVLKCRPPRNRDPQPEEVARCEPFLARQIELLSPRIIVVMGRFAAQSLLKTDASIASLRGRLHGYALAGRRVPVVVTYHPAYLLRSLGDKAKAWSDLCLARECVERSGDAPEGDRPAAAGV